MPRSGRHPDTVQRRCSDGKNSLPGYLSPNEFERRAAAATRPVGNGDQHDRTDLEAFPIGEPEVPNYPPGVPCPPVLVKTLLATGYRSPQCGWRQPRPVHRSAVAPVVGIFPNEDAVRQPSGAVLLEHSDEWAVSRRYMALEFNAPVSDNPTAELPAVAA